MNTRLLRLGYWLSFFAFLCTLTPLVVKDLHPIASLRYYPEPGALYPAYIVLFLVYAVGFANFYLFKAIAHSDGIRRMRLIYFTASTFFGFLGGIFLFLAIYNFPITPHLSVIILGFPFAITFSIIRYKEFDVEEIALAAQRNKLETLGILSASINHELKNPIYIMRTLADSFLLHMKAKAFEGNEKGGLQNAVETCEKTILHADRAMDIVRRLTNFTKQEAKDAPMQAVDVRKILEDVHLFLRYDIQISNIRLSWDIADDFPKIYGQPRYLEQIFFNLIVNACQAIKKFKKNEGSIQITGKKLPAAVQITIEDNGPGISKDILPKIFEPFYTTKETGTGLGLYITRQLVEKNGGTIAVDSQPDKTTFTLKMKIA